MIESVRWPNTLAARSRTSCGAGRDDLRQAEQLGHRLALGDALGAERDVDVDALLGQQRLGPGGDAGVDRAAQHDQLARAHVLRAVEDRLGHRMRIRVEMPVDRGADDDDDRVGLTDDLRDRCSRPAGRCARARSSISAAPSSMNGILRRVDRVDRLGVHVIDRGVEPTIGERDRQRQADVAASADDDDVVLHLSAIPSRNVFATNSPSRTGVRS